MLNDSNCSGRQGSGDGSREALIRLPGIGPVLAARIIAVRRCGGTQALAVVEGIGRATLARLEE